MNGFTDMIDQCHVVLTEGGVVERIRRHPEVELDPFITHAGLIYQEKGRRLLESIYREYIGIGREYGYPFMTLAPTWRANPERINQSNFRDVQNINQDGVHFLKQIRDGFSNYGRSIYIGGMMGCKGDAYRPAEALTKKEAELFHQEQAGYLAESGVDFIKAATLPAVSEAYGMASAISRLGIPYILSFVIKPGGTLLDGTPLHEAIQWIDMEIDPRPLFYMINCVHPSIFNTAMHHPNTASTLANRRILGFQANTSAKSPEELDRLSYLDTSDPRDFAGQMIELHKQYGLKVLGGCCGSDAAHIVEIAKQLSKE